jgi:hypothetical protein
MKREHKVVQIASFIEEKERVIYNDCIYPNFVIVVM